jgi:glucose/arabinose dehydrogenase
MHRCARILAGSLVFASVLAAAPSARAATALSAVRIASGLTRPVFVTSPPGDPRLFIVEQRDSENRGRIRIFKYGAGGGLLSRPFLTTTTELATGNEQGLLGLAFAPDYATSGRFYINYTDSLGHTHIERHVVSATDPDSANDAGETILFIHQPYNNHNGGWIAFGPDGYLYIATGDGGSGGDPQNRAQKPDSLLGKILRIDVSPETGYAIPPTNPYAGATPGADEVYAIGLRNPFRDSFDRATGDLIIGDVGQLKYEEIDFAPASAGRGLGVNFGWPCYEGFHDYDLDRPTVVCPTCIAPACMQEPAWEYDHTGRCSVTGGYVYRGSAIPDLVGTYFFADYCGAQIYSGKFVGGALTSFADRTLELDPVNQTINVNSISSFGEDAEGELYICDLGGEVFKIVPLAAVDVPPSPAPRVPVLALAGAMPFRGSLRLALDLRVAARVRLTVLDLAGRKVRDLMDETLPAGQHAATWDGKDARGADTPPGVYLVRAVTPMGEESLRAVRVR